MEIQMEIDFAMQQLGLSKKILERKSILNTFLNEYFTYKETNFLFS